MFKNFSFLNLKLVDVLEANGFREPTKIQTETIKKFNRDIVVQSQTGSGKTLAYLIPIANYLYIRSSSMSSIISLIVAPTRELALQIQKVADMLNLSSICFIGGEDATKLENIKIEASVVIGTPGIINFIVKNHHKDFQKIKYLILDEADRLLSLNFETQIKSIISHIPRQNRITGFFSATINENVRKLAKQTINFIEIIIDEILPSNLVLKYMITQPEHKLNILMNLIEKNKKVIVFFNTCLEVDYFYQLINKKIFDNKLIKIHGKMKQSDRCEIFKEVIDCDKFVLLCTDVISRGIDIKNIDLVVHFDIPKESSSIIHRSGRTARNNQVGESILFLMENESKYVKYLKIKEKLKDEEIVEIKTHLPAKDIFDQTEIEDENLNVKAFVSYLRSYKEHLANFVLNIKELNMESQLKLFKLKKMPIFKEFKRSFKK
ncbi:SPB4 [Hepatospora eriocheir]|uniref:ATP-dependent RNA helicase n=1 Tax=Hepatospora eriocheir TaxID=1081669 RepID=A0A1X0QIZ0_9MICR|nr:SPB4 [Hepatospora eriocheir]